MNDIITIILRRFSLGVVVWSGWRLARATSSGEAFGFALVIATGLDAAIDTYRSKP